MSIFGRRFERSNTAILKESIQKSILASFGANEHVLYENMFMRRNLVSVNEAPSVKPEVEAGEPEPFYPMIHVDNNETEDTSYIKIDKEMFEGMNQRESDELVYQLFNQLRIEDGLEYEINVPTADGILKVPVSVASKEYTQEEKEQKEQESKDSGAEDTAEHSEAAQESKDEAEKEGEEGEAKRMPQNPAYTDSNPKWATESQSEEAQNFRGREGEPTENDIKDIARVQAILEHAIQGDNGGKCYTISPGKRLNMRAIISETSEKEYIGNRGEDGKTLKINLVVDRSGSMHGNPTRESNILISALNNIVLDNEELEVNVIFTQTRSRLKIQLPVDTFNSPELWAMNAANSAEGLAETIDHYFEDFKAADINLCYTDGSIMDKNLDKAYMESQEVNFVGLYVNSSFTEEDVMKHYEKNAKYFTKVVIRADMKALVDELGSLMLLHKGH